MSGGRRDLGERVEDRDELVGRDSEAVVTHAHVHGRVAPIRRQPDLPAVRRVFRRVVEEVDENLRDPNGVRVKRDGFRRHMHDQPVTAVLDPGADRIDSVADDRHVTADRDGVLTNAADDLLALGRRSMGEVQPEDVDTGCEQAVNDVIARAGRSERGDGLLEAPARNRAGF